MRCSQLLLSLAVAGCTMTPEQRAAQAERDYGALCEKRGLAAGTEKWRACVETESLNAALATQRAYDERFLRQHDCVTPLTGCGTPSR